MQQNIMFIVDAQIIEKASQRARAENTTLNVLFQVWLEQSIAQPAAPVGYDALMAQFGHADAGQHFNRDDMNEH